MKNIFKKIGFLCCGLLSIFALNFSSAKCEGLSQHGDCGTPTTIVVEPEIIDPNTGNISPEDPNNGISWFGDLVNGIIHPQKDAGEYATKLERATTLIQIAINYLLGILSLIALVYILYCGFVIFSAGSDDAKVKKGKKGLTTAAIALAGIGVSWLIVSLMLRFIDVMTKID